ncbi:MDR family MFS transporter [Neomicrococcus lactis]
MKNSSNSAPDIERLSPSSVMTISVLIVSAFVMILNETIMNVALPTLMEQFSVSADRAQWLSTSFMLTLAVIIPTTGYLLRRLSIRQVYTAAMSLFILGTALAASSQFFEMLLASRVIQASGTAVMMPLLMTTVLDLVPVSRRGQIMGNVSIVISVAPAIGPTLSGLILQWLSWRFMFVVVLPIALIALIIGFSRVPNNGGGEVSHLSIPSILLSVPGFGGLVYGLSNLGGGHDAAATAGASQSTIAWVAIAISVVCLTAFVLLQLRLQRSNKALLDMRPFTYREYTLSLITMVLAMVALFGVIILAPLYLQQVRGLSTLQTGLMLLPGGILMGVLAPFVGRWYDKIGARSLVVPGSILLSLVLWQFTRFDASTPIWLILALMFTMNMSFALLFTPLFTTALNPLPHSLHSHGSALLSALQQLGGAAGTALLIGLMVSGTAAAAAQGADPITAEVSGLQHGYTAAAIVSVLMVVLCFFMPGKKAPEELPAP